MVKRYQVAGRVQRVGFRAFVLRRAQKIGLNGWVRNLSDGTVEALVDGSEPDHAEFEMSLREGPRFSAVQLVLVVDLPDSPPMARGFTIAGDGG